MISVRFTLSALQLLDTLPPEKREKVKEIVSKRVLGLVKPDDIRKAIKELEFPKVVVRRPSPVKEAKEEEAKIKVDPAHDVTGKSFTQSRLEDFVKYFRNRYERIRRLFPAVYDVSYSQVHVEDLEKMQSGERVLLHVMVYAKEKVKSGNLVLTVEDPTGLVRVVVRKKDEQIYEKVRDEVILDDVIRIYGRWLGGVLLAEDIEFPDLPAHPRPRVESDVAIMYLSDTHFGSKLMLKKIPEKIVKGLRGEDPIFGDLAGKIKYIVVAGDVVDGIGIYPGQEKELEVKDIELQYKLFDEFLWELPDYIEVVVIPGNHDAVRRAEPSPAIPKDFISRDAYLLGNPSVVQIEGLKHLLYHGTSIDGYISSIPKLSYTEPSNVMIEMLKRRHLSTTYGLNPITPEHVDYLVIDVVPDVFHAGHVHKNDIKMYKNTLVVNSGTFQDQTEFQLKMGHMPTPGLVYVYHPKSEKIRVFNLLK